jgi:carboxylate-amine ligase
VRENKWQAIRYGLDATVIDAHGTPIPIRDHILSTLDELAHTGAELESERSLFDIERIVRAGTGADRQLATFAETTDLRAVTGQIVTETRAAAPVVA